MGIDYTHYIVVGWETDYETVLRLIPDLEDDDKCDYWNNHDFFQVINTNTWSSSKYVVGKVLECIDVGQDEQIYRFSGWAIDRAWQIMKAHNGELFAKFYDACGEAEMLSFIGVS